MNYSNYPNDARQEKKRKFWEAVAKFFCYVLAIGLCFAAANHFFGMFERNFKTLIKGNTQPSQYYHRQSPNYKYSIPSAPVKITDPSAVPTPIDTVALKMKMEELKNRLNNTSNNFGSTKNGF